MGLFSLFGKAKDMDDGVAEARSTEGAFLIDVREPNEFASGHVAGASLPAPLRTGTCWRARRGQVGTHLPLLRKRREVRPRGGQAQVQGVHERARHRRYQGLYGSA